MSSRIDRVTFTGSQGDQLAARLDLPAGPPKAFALFAHCFTCGKDLRSVGRLAVALTDAGFGVLRFDFTGLGSSDGEFANTNFKSNTDDLLAAVGWLREHHRAPQVLVGHSLGGAAVLHVAGEVDEVRAVVTIGAPADTEHLVGLLDGSLDDLAERGEAEVDVAGRKFTVRQQFLDDLTRHDISQKVGAMRKPLLVLHSPIDNVVGVENAAEIFQAARHPKSFVSLDGADHLLSDPLDAEFAAASIAAFATRYVEDQSGALDAPAATNAVVVAETSQGPFLNHVVVGRHRLLADEPTSIGGFDAGPAPYDFLGAALGACTSMTLRMYADRKKLPLDRVSVEVSHDKVHADDCVECAENEHLVGRTGMIDRFERAIVLEGADLSDDDRKRLLLIADKCPVHRTLEASSVIATHLAT
ncbi:bifunctional alpha/beta hydrolase/OsmC family protein [Ilumatobacter coccineus]|uniref:Putative hydrolase n=1 Tax=Ilumatobacter coccineus (strain NBRC 103263 / KCTC 29153 / YM16-304) TaxID=1313172 RepID=A0A6C7ECB9_ILUCY|nr:bifunctional alpha/beta hydrolase/OsmC family protein [Ilumatobacter coccineus]BAN03963.1 putative hydrolase [Ilumatobacter coccineus YM16-304]